MEIVGSFLDEEWESLSQIFLSGENLDFFQHCEIPSPSFFPSHHQTNFSCISQESSEIDESLFLNSHENEHHHHQQQQQQFDINTFESMMNFHNNAGNFMLPNDAITEDFLRSKGENRALETTTADDVDESCQMKRKAEVDQDKSEDYPPQNPKKKPRFSRNKNKTVQPKKGKKALIQDKNNEEEINGGGNRQSCSSYSSEEDSNASQELNEETNNSNGKARASRGSATDPQSLYARRRRERINERLKILQNLVPNGTKVDISTMLEEAVQYVKFLQLQIKLLSSDNLWMYAPLAYNGMDIGVYQNICPNL